MSVHKSLVQATFVQDTIASSLSTCNSITDTPQTLYISAHSIRTETFIVFLSKYILENNTDVFFILHMCIYIYVKQKKILPRSKRYYTCIMYLRSLRIHLCNIRVHVPRKKERERELYTHVHVSYTILRDNPSVHTADFFMLSIRDHHLSIDVM